MLLVPVPRSRLMGDSGRRDLLWDFGLIPLAPQLMSIPDPRPGLCVMGTLAPTLEILGCQKPEWTRFLCSD